MNQVISPKRSKLRARVEEITSSDNSISVEASHSDDDLPVIFATRKRLKVHRNETDVITNFFFLYYLQISRAREKHLKRMLPDSLPCHYKTSHLCKVVTPDSSDEDESLSPGCSGKSDDPDNAHLSSSGYVETHSDSDADGERSGTEETPKKIKRKVFRRKKGVGNGSISAEDFPPKDMPGLEIQEMTSQDDSESTAPQGMEDSPSIGFSPVDKNTTTENGSAQDSSLEPTAVISELSNLVHMTDSSMIPELLEASDGSYSSRISTKSEKNMADFDGEESHCEDELVQSLAQNQLVDIPSRGQVCKKIIMKSKIVFRL